ncbi:MAG: hypothetical protein BM564_09365 [Bacteroidetes bacterium MedPE-SWsnd-G2]|nr:MAG: hypothetical protein BM564_09365 [Bacteroidetes bacterium MedPE-SWsnd-G2]
MKYTVTAILLFLATTFSFSQDTKYGVRAAYSISNLNYSSVPVNDNPHRNGFVFGVFVDIGISDVFSIVPELHFSSEGADKEDFRNDYLNLPVTAKYNFAKKWTVGLGPQLGLKVNKKDDGFKNFVFAGVGLIEFKITEELSLDARYNYGFSNVFDNHLMPEAKNEVIQLGINYKI